VLPSAAITNFVSGHKGGSEKSIMRESSLMVRDGYLYGITLLAVAAAVYFLTGGWVWTLIPIVLAAFFLWFFRDPPRAIPQGEGRLNGS
jgi:hypothetical protein